MPTAAQEGELSGRRGLRAGETGACTPPPVLRAAQPLLVPPQLQLKGSRGRGPHSRQLDRMERPTEPRVSSFRSRVVRGSWGPAQSLPQDRSMAYWGRCTLQRDTPCSHSLGGGGSPPVSWETDRAELWLRGRTLQQDASSHAKPALVLQRELWVQIKCLAVA